jgi:hypothetical protein
MPRRGDEECLQPKGRGAANDEEAALHEHGRGTEISDEGPLPRFPVGKEKPPLLREQQAPSVRLASLVIEQDSFQSA